MSFISVIPVQPASGSKVLEPRLPFSSELAPALAVILRRCRERHDDQVSSEDVGVGLFRSCCLRSLLRSLGGLLPLRLRSALLEPEAGNSDIRGMCMNDDKEREDVLSTYSADPGIFSGLEHRRSRRSTSLTRSMSVLLLSCSSMALPIVRQSSSRSSGRSDAAAGPVGPNGASSPGADADRPTLD